MSDPVKAVFLSYASQDAEAAHRLCNALRAAAIEVWFDQSELRGGDAWDASIRRQIKNCALFVPVISENTHARGEGYFRLEWKLAVDRSHLMASDQPFLLPVVIDDTPDQEERVPDRFREVQWTRLPAGANAAAFVDHVRRLLSLDASMPAATSVRSSASPTASTRLTPPTSRSFVTWIAGGLLILAAGYLGVDKFLTSKHAVSAVEAPATPSADVEAVSDKSIAVLPFADMSEKKDQEYFADGMAEEILDVLAKVPRLTVISRTSSFQFKGRDVDVKSIGLTLRSRYIVEGSVRKSGDSMRITAQLIDARDGSRRWSETYDRKVDDAFKVQDEIAGSLVRALQLAVGAGEMSRMNVALRLDPLNPNILFTRGWVLFWPGLLPEAKASFRESIQISPTYESAHLYLGHVLLAHGELTEALTEMNRELDNESRLAGIASVQFAMGHKKESDAALAQLVKLSSDDWALGIASVHAIRNEPDAVFEWLDRAYAQKDEDLYLIKGNPLFRNIASDPRYAAFLRKMKLPE